MAPATGICSVLQASHREGEQCFEPDSKAQPWSRLILTGRIKTRSTARAALIFMAPATGICSVLQASHREGEQCFEPDSKAQPWSRLILTGRIKTRSTARVALIFMAPATGIEPVTNP